MATVTYRGPRPELVVSMPMPVADFIALADGSIHVVRYVPFDKRPEFARHDIVHLIRNEPLRCGALFALGLAMIRRRPSPWFTVKLDRGEFAEIAHRIPDDGDGATFRERVLAYLHWGRAQIQANLAGESKALVVNGDPVWRP